MYLSMTSNDCPYNCPSAATQASIVIKVKHHYVCCILKNHIFSNCDIYLGGATDDSGIFLQYTEKP